MRRRPLAFPNPGDRRPVDSGAAEPEKAHGAHTLRPWRGVVVGKSGDDVFVELGPRMQGVISLRRFAEPPAMGDEFTFTLRGKEESLWVLELEDQGILATWEDMEPGCLVQARVLRVVPGGLQLKIGPLHAFLPNSQTGLPREKKPGVLVGRNLTCEVIEVDPERQRVIVSRKAVAKRERTSQSTRAAGHLRPGQVVQGRVTRIEDFGVFMSFGHGLTGMVHVSNLSHEHVAHPSELVKLGQSLEAQVLHVRRGGRRIGLGVKQLAESPWKRVEFEHYEGQIVEGRITRSADFGVFVALGSGVEGLLPNSESGESRRRAGDVLSRGDLVSVRIVQLDLQQERLVLSVLHPGGARIAPEEAQNAAAFAELREPEGGSLVTDLGRLLRDALRGGGSGPRELGTESA